MTDIIVVGGYYRETCRFPEVDEFSGSGGRAALALGEAGYAVSWHYFREAGEALAAQAILPHPQIAHHGHDRAGSIAFSYVHPLSRPIYTPSVIPRAEMPPVAGDDVLRFDMMEGSAVVHADRCVYDPQNPRPDPFHRNGSTANALAIVLNAYQVLRYGLPEGETAGDEKQAVASIVGERPDTIVVVKAGADGCRVYEGGDQVKSVPAYRSEKVYKIGTGDVFSATFAAYWSLEGRGAVEAADEASRSVADYVETRAPLACPRSRDTPRDQVSDKPFGNVYLAAPIFTMSDIWMVEETMAALESLGVPVFSPLHDVGRGDPNAVVQADLAGIDECKAMIALIDGMDPGTLFEVGYAIKQGIPVVVLAQSVKTSDLTMMIGSPGAEVVDDFATAVYRAAWASRW